MPKLTAKDYRQFALTLYQYAESMLDTEVGTTIINNANKILDIVSREDYLIKYGDEILPEEFYIESGLENVIEESLKNIKEASKNVQYAQGGLQKTLLDHAIWEHERILEGSLSKRDTTQTFGELMTNHILSKWANTTLTPKVDPDLYEDFPEVGPSGTNLKGNMRKAKYTLKELDESFKKNKIPELLDAGHKYHETLNYVRTLMKNGVDINSNPEIRNKLIEDGRRLEKAMEDTIEVAKTKDEVAMRMYNDGAYVNDFALEGGRSLRGALPGLRTELAYYRSGLPLEGLDNYKKLVKTADNLKVGVENLNYGYIQNDRMYKSNVLELEGEIRAIPEKDNIIRDINQWMSNVEQSVKKTQKEYSWLANNMVIGRNHNTGEDASNDKKNEIKRNYGKKSGPYINNLKTIEKFSKAEFILEPNKKTKELDIFKPKVEDLERLNSGRTVIGDKLKELKGNIKNIDPALSSAIDKTIKVFDKDSQSSLSDLQKSLKKLQKAVNDEKQKYAGVDNAQRTAYEKIKDEFDYVRLLDGYTKLNNYLVTVNQDNGLDRNGVAAELEKLNTLSIYTHHKRSLSEVVKLLRDPETSDEEAKKQFRYFKNAMDGAKFEVETEMGNEAKEYFTKYGADRKNFDLAEDPSISIGNFADYVNKAKNYIDMKVKTALSNGISVETSINRQKELLEANNEVRLDEALNKFNTRRSAIFGKGENYDPNVGKETTEHRKARQAVEKVQKELGKLNKINIELDPQAWKMQAEVVKEKIVTASNLTHEYLQAKGYAANTSAGQDRIDGGLEIRKELVHLHTKINRQMELSQLKGKLTGNVNENILNDGIINTGVNMRDNRISNISYNSLKDKIIGNKKDDNVINRKSNVSENIIENEIENKNEANKKTSVKNSGILS